MRDQIGLVYSISSLIGYQFVTIPASFHHPISQFNGRYFNVYSVEATAMGFTVNLVSAFTLILGIQLINISIVTAATVNIHGLIQRMDYEPPNQGGPDSSQQGSGTR